MERRWGFVCPRRTVLHVRSRLRCNGRQSVRLDRGEDDGDHQPGRPLQGDRYLELTSVYSAGVAITDADVHLDHAFDPGGLVDVEPEATYLITLLDLTTGTSTTALSGELNEEDEAFAGASAPVAVVGGHTYQLSIEAVIAQSTLALSTLSGTTSLRFDNVGLAVRSGSEGKGGGGGRAGGKGSGSSSGSLSDRQLFSLLSSGTSASPALLKGSGRRLFVKVGCPVKVGHACKITAQGLLSKRKPATTKRTVKVPKGKNKRIALRVKPKARGKVTKRKRLLFREKVRAGKAQATVYRQRKLIRRG